MTQKPIVIIGAGLSGLCCARELRKRGLDVLMLEAQNEIGGRVRTDLVDGFLLDRGFQVLQTAYPEASAQLDYQSLRLRNFEPGALIRTQGRFVGMSDPWRRPGKLLSTAFNGIGTFADRLKLARLRWHVTHTSDDELWSEPETTTLEYLRSTCGLSSDMVDRFFRPWFSGVFLEKELATSSRFFRYLFRIFALGDASLPELGMGAIPKQLAATFPSGMIRLHAPVESLDSHSVKLRSGEVIEGSAVVLAVEGPEASRLTGGIVPAPAARSTTCFYYAAPRPPFEEPLLVLNGDGEGPINNLCVVTNVAPGYAPAGQALVSVSVIGDESSHSDATEDRVRRQLVQWYGSQVSQWTLLRRYRIAYALPRQPSGFRDDGRLVPRLSQGLYRCGDYCETSSIQGAMLSGRKAAENILVDLGIKI